MEGERKREQGPKEEKMRRHAGSVADDVTVELVDNSNDARNDDQLQRNGEQVEEEEESPLVTKNSESQAPTEASGKKKFAVLVALCFLMVVQILLVKYSRHTASPDAVMYISSTAVVCTEAMKFILSFVVEVLWERRSSSAEDKNLGEIVEDTLHDMAYDRLGEVFVPALFFTLQNNLVFVAISFLPVGIYQVTSQLKIATAAFFTFFLLKQRLSLMQVVAVGVLILGVSIVEVSQLAEASNTDSDLSEMTIGMAAVLGAVVLSGYANVYFELVLKGKKASGDQAPKKELSIYLRNMQLAIFSIGFGLFDAALYDAKEIILGGFFQGYRPIVYLVVFVNACGGLLVALTLKHAGNLLKCFAVALSIIFSTCLSVVLFDATIDAAFTFGAILVIVALFLFSSYPPDNDSKAGSQTSSHQSNRGNKGYLFLYSIPIVFTGLYVMSLAKNSDSD